MQKSTNKKRKTGTKKQKTVLAFGVFDELHPGHHFFLSEARRKGGRLIVAPAHDYVVRGMKGRVPRQSLALRMRSLRSSGLADLVTAGDRKLGSWRVIDRVRPQVIAVGHDQHDLLKALKAHRKKTQARFAISRIRAHKPKHFHSSKKRK